MLEAPPSPSIKVQLPVELVTMILRYALVGDSTLFLTHLGNGEPERLPLNTTRERLKGLRLEGRVFSDAVTAAVFASIHLHASQLSVTRAESIANSALATHVKEIVQHQGTFADRNKDRQLFLSTLASHRRRQDYPQELRAIDRDEFYAHFLEEIESAKCFDRAGGFKDYPFRPLLDKLPNCQTFVSLPYHDEWHDPETSSYTLRRTGLSYLPMPGVTDFAWAHKFDSAMRVFRPQSLNLSLFPCEAVHVIVAPTSVRCPDPARDDLDDLECARSRFDKLEDLKLGPAYGAKYGYGGGEEWSLDTMLLLRACDNLVSLELTNDYPLNRRFALLPQDGLPRLRKLTISKGTTLGYWPSTGLFACIKNVGSTLQDLHFDGIVLKYWAHGSSNASTQPHDLMGAPIGSMIRLLYEVTAHTSLRSCTGLGTVQDVKSEITRKGTNVRSGPKPGKRVLVGKLEQAVCHRCEWPSNLSLLLALSSTPNASGADPILDAASKFMNAHWDDTVDEFEVASRQVVPRPTMDDRWWLSSE